MTDITSQSPTGPSPVTAEPTHMTPPPAWEVSTSDLPALPEASPLVAPEAAPEEPVSPPPARRRLRAVLRWTSAVAVFTVLCGATAYAVTQPERTKIPGLKTPGDGRWTYPPHALPKLPAGKPRPLADTNPGGHHYVDLRSLLLPVPLTATMESSVPGRTGWLPTDTFVRLYDNGGDGGARSQSDLLKQDGLRHITARAWTMPDGTRSEIYALQFISSGYAAIHKTNIEDQRLKVAPESVQDTTAQSTVFPPQIVVRAFAESKPYGATAARYAYIYAGDTIALVIQTRKGAVPEVPFRQTVRLQAQLLG